MDPITITVAVIGTLTVLASGAKPLMNRLALPPSVAHIAIGFGLAVLDHHIPVLPEPTHAAVELFAGVGIVFLLFRVGLESDLEGLIEQLRRAGVVAASNVALTAFLGYGAARWLAGLDPTASLLIGAAFTATSVGVSVGVWQDAGALNGPRGRLLLDVAELDDIIAVVLMGLLFAVLPALRGGERGLLEILAAEGGVYALQMAAFIAVCYLFASYLEKSLTHFICRLEPAPERMISVVSIGLLIAALAGALGFSLAIGAFFAGLIFSRDPEAVKMEASFLPLYDLFAPFFFIGLGLRLDPSGLTSALGLGALLAAAAVVSKVLANGLPALIWFGPAGALLIGTSMVPRAEIAMIIARQGLDAGVLSNKVYGGLVMVSAVTCLLAPPVVGRMLKAWPPPEKEKNNEEQSST